MRYLAEVFPDRFLHLGGDELPTACWEADPALRREMERHGGATSLFENFLNRASHIAAGFSRESIFWQEPLDGGIRLRSRPVFQTWKDWDQGGVNLAKRAQNAAIAEGHRTLNSAGWYLDYDASWEQMYYTKTQMLPDAGDSPKPRSARLPPQRSIPVGVTSPLTAACAGRPAAGALAFLCAPRPGQSVPHCGRRRCERGAWLHPPTPGLTRCTVCHSRHVVGARGQHQPALPRVASRRRSGGAPVVRALGACVRWR